MNKKIEDEKPDNDLTNADLMNGVDGDQDIDEPDQEDDQQQEPDQPEAEETVDEGQNEDNDSDQDDQDNEEKPKNEGEAYARLRRETKAREAAERERAELQRQLDESRNSQQQQQTQSTPQKENDPEPADKTSYEWMAWKVRDQDRRLNEYDDYKQQQMQSSENQQVLQGAVQEFQQYENAFAQTVDDYNEASEALQKGVMEDIRSAHPNATPQQVAQEYQNRILSFAGMYARMGQDPARSLYHLAKNNYGYEKQNAPSQQNKVTDLKTIERNRKKSMSPTSGGGQSGKGEVTQDEVSGMTNAEIMRLSPQEIERLESNG